MKDFFETIGLLLGSIALMVGGVLCCVYEESAKTLVLGPLAGLIGAAGTVGMVWVIIRDAKAGTLLPAPKYFKHEQAMEGEEMALELPFPVLHEHFQRLAAKDDTACAEDSFLSWDNGQSCGIRIYSMGGDAWAAACDLHRITALQRKDVTALCRRHKAKITDKAAVFNVLVFYQDGKLALYPRKAAKSFREAFLSPEDNAGLLTTGEVFDKWLAAWTEEG